MSSISINGAIVARLSNGEVGEHNIRLFYSQYMEKQLKGQVTIKPLYRELCLFKIRLAFFQQLRIIFGKTYFKSYNAITDILNELA